MTEEDEKIIEAQMGKRFMEARVGEAHLMDFKTVMKEKTQANINKLKALKQKEREGFMVPTGEYMEALDDAIKELSK